MKILVEGEQYEAIEGAIGPFESEVDVHRIPCVGELIQVRVPTRTLVRFKTDGKTTIVEPTVLEKRVTEVLHYDFSVLSHEFVARVRV